MLVRVICRDAESRLLLQHYERARKIATVVAKILKLYVVLDVTSGNTSVSGETTASGVGIASDRWAMELA